MTDPKTDGVRLLACPLCQSATDLHIGVCYPRGSSEKEPAVRCDNCGCRATMKAWNTRSAPARCDAGSANDIRALGWSVAVHNDYRLNGLRHTFWLFTKDGAAIKGEGDSDAAALDQVRTALAAPPALPAGEEVRRASWIDQNYQIDRYGVALMMIREGCADPAGLARRILSEFEFALSPSSNGEPATAVTSTHRGTEA